MWRHLLALVMVGYVPGAVLFRLPFWDRPRRAALCAEERAYWAVMLSIIITTTAALVLAWLGVYTLERVMMVNAAISLLLSLASLGDLRLGASARQIGWSAVIPAALIALGVWMYFAVPAAEYVVGGRDPGVYMNQGIQIAQKRSLVTLDPIVHEVPPPARDLFFPPYNGPGYFSLRFMGFFLIDPDEGSIVGQFPHGYPIWTAIGYGIDGLSGTRRVPSWWAVLGVVAVYFAASQIVGRGTAAAGAALLAVHIIQTWHARYPNSEIITQVLLFAGLHAHARAHAEDDAFFGPVSASLLGLAVFVRFPAVLAVGAAGVATLLIPAAGRRMRLGFVLMLAAWMAVAGLYYTTLLAPYFARPLLYVRFLNPMHVSLAIAGAAGVFALILGTRRPRVAALIRDGLPIGLVAGLAAAAVYGYFLRTPGGTLAPQDAYSLRTFTDFYLTPAGLGLAVIGWGLVVSRSFWRSPALLLTVTTFAAFFFFKLRIFPEQFWTTRRFLDVILPAALLFVSAAALLPLSQVVAAPWASRRGVSFGRAAIGILVVTLLGREYLIASEAIRKHIEYAGVIPHLEQISRRFGDKDLVLVESRAASDVHTLALPLADIYARNVLMLHSPRPDKGVLADFLTSARRRYDSIYFIGAGGTDLLGPGVAAERVNTERFEVPEYEATQHDVYPRASRLKPFAFTIYRIVDSAAPPGRFSIDVGEADDLQLVQFHPKERTGDRRATYRWTQDVSYLLPPHIEAGNREIVLRLSNGGRPSRLTPARVTVYLDNRELGSAEPVDPFADYSFAIPPELAAALATRRTAPELRLNSSTWIPRAALGGNDGRQLGVMVDRAEIR